MLLPSKIQVDETEIISVTVPSFFEDLEDVLNRTSNRAKANYLIWRVALYASGYMTNEQRQRKLQYLATVSGQQVEEPRWKECIAYTASRYLIQIKLTVSHA